MKTSGSQSLRFSSVLILACSLSLSLGIVDIIISIWERPPEPFFFPLIPSFLASGVVFLFATYMVLWFLVVFCLGRILKLQAAALTYSFSLFFFAAFLLIIIYRLPHTDRLQDLAGQLRQIPILLFSSLAGSVIFYLLMKAFPRVFYYLRKASLAVILMPFFLLWSVVLLWLLAHSYETRDFFSNEALPLTLGYALVLIATAVLSYFSSVKTRKRLLAALMIVILLVPLALASANEITYAFSKLTGQQKEPRIKRVILVTVDTLRPDVLSCYNPEGLPTPNIDRLAEDGIMFSNAFSAAPWTLPSFSSIMTGLSPFVHRTTTSTSKFPDSFKTLAEYMLDAGYYTSAIVWNYYMHPRHNLSQGFLHYDFFPRKLGNSLGLNAFQFLAATWSSPFLNEASTDDLTDLATGWIESNMNKEFFLWLHYYDPHVPYGPPRAFQPEGTPPPRIGRNFFKQNEIRDGKLIPTPAEKEWIRKLYEGEVLYVEENIGRLLDRLQELKIYDESLIVFTSDHGEEFWEHNGYEHGHSLYNEVLWVPLIIKLPASHSQRRIDHRVSTQGLTPTILDIMGIDYESNDISTRPFSHLWANKSDLDGQPIVSSGLLYGQQRESIIYDGMKYIFSFRSRAEELYDLDNDPRERISISDTNGETMRRVRQLLLTHKRAARRLSHYYLTEKPEDVVIDKDTTEKLKSLGYIQ